MLASSRKILYLHHCIAQGRWGYSLAVPVSRIGDLTVGLVAFGKILVPGLSGPETVDSMHWTRIDVPADSATRR